MHGRARSVQFTAESGEATAGGIAPQITYLPQILHFNAASRRALTPTVASRLSFHVFGGYHVLTYVANSLRDFVTGSRRSHFIPTPAL